MRADNFHKLLWRPDEAFTEDDFTGDNEVWNAAMTSLELSMRCANLAIGLRDAAVLCRAWELGQDSAPDLDGDWVHASETHMARPGSWFPGCGKEAPND